MKLVKTYGKSAKVAGELIEAIERRGATNTAKVENTVAKILTGVRQGGDWCIYGSGTGGARRSTLEHRGLYS